MARHRVDIWRDILRSAATRVLLDYAGALLREGDAQEERPA